MLSTHCGPVRVTAPVFEFECYDVGHLYNLANFLDRGLVQRPLFIQSVFGILGGIGTHPEDVVHMRRTADRLFGGTTAGLSWVPDASSFRSPPWPLRWVATYAWDWRTAYGSDQANWQPATPFKCIAPGKLSKVWDSKSQHRQMHARSYRSREAIRLPSRFETAPDRLSTLQSARNAFCLFYDPENQAMASVWRYCR